MIEVCKIILFVNLSFELTLLFFWNRKTFQRSNSEYLKKERAKKQFYKVGELEKKGHIVKNWRKRWFVLDNDTLKYFKARQDSKAQGSIFLRGSTCSRSSAFEFEIHDSKNNKSFVIKGGDKQEVDCWC